MGLFSQKKSTKGITVQTTPLFLIPELIEKILLNLPAIDVLTKYRGVCKTWKDLIENTSPDLKYYSTSGLRRPDPDAVKVKPSRARPRSTPDRSPHPQLLTPIAIDILSVFWKRLAKDGIIVDKPKQPRREWAVGTFFRRKQKDEALAEHVQRRSESRRSSSSSSINKFQKCICIAAFILIYLPVSRTLKATSFIKPKTSKVGRRKRAVASLGRKLIKEFIPVWQKVQIFKPHSPEFRGVLIGAGTNWKHRSISPWDSTLSLPKKFTKLSDAANALMTPLIEAIYSGKLLFVDAPTDPSITPDAVAQGPAVGIDLTYEFDELVTRINRYDGAAKESFMFGAHEPFNVSCKFTRIAEDEGATWGVSVNTLWRADQTNENMVPEIVSQRP
ncbi:hypothetical protein TWF106_010201 [Orbilia oligospora]|uniref:F-box domain-containing protein n=1 Tax=Orbilia oligospora TaxID=2813651 RepID=A0A6G1MLJ6_ORBOL|nr:hypothetical protein TWF788_005659 [Orbilia oligospora]KAF3211479.1 hypothetical protein TWF106_010201 [Orbilia oligospora]KAF3211588.1 hypothetical protein TWF679_006393 [Orbilia oligospora]KAF3261610.1 hypothetical protein TWF192_008073 [Orbilia oligospora]